MGPFRILKKDVQPYYLCLKGFMDLHKNFIMADTCLFEILFQFVVVTKIKKNAFNRLSAT